MIQAVATQAKGEAQTPPEAGEVAQLEAAARARVRSVEQVTLEWEAPRPAPVEASAQPEATQAVEGTTARRASALMKTSPTGALSWWVANP